MVRGRRRERTYRVRCDGSGHWIRGGDVARGRADLFSCPYCHALVHRRADGKAPEHLREVI